MHHYMNKKDAGKNLDNLLFAVFVDGCELDLKELIRLYGDYMSEIYKENDNNYFRYMSLK